jgi:hypothetical protein
MANTYQGFTGQNYSEDDLERERAGGFVKFNNNYPNSALQNIINDPNSLISKKENSILSNPNLENKNDEVEKFNNIEQQREYTKLDDIHKRINDRSLKMKNIVDEAAKKYPGIAFDLQNDRDDHFEEFLSAYPEYKKLMDEGESDRQEYMNNPIGENHFMDILKKQGQSALAGHSFTQEQFSKIMDYLNKNKQMEQ